MLRRAPQTGLGACSRLQRSEAGTVDTYEAGTPKPYKEEWWHFVDNSRTSGRSYTDCSRMRHETDRRSRDLQQPGTIMPAWPLALPDCLLDAERLHRPSLLTVARVALSSGGTALCRLSAWFGGRGVTVTLWRSRLLASAAGEEVTRHPSEFPCPGSLRGGRPADTGTEPIELGRASTSSRLAADESGTDAQLTAAVRVACTLIARPVQ